MKFLSRSYQRSTFLSNCQEESLARPNAHVPRSRRVPIFLLAYSAIGLTNFSDATAHAACPNNCDDGNECTLDRCELRPFLPDICHNIPNVGVPCGNPGECEDAICTSGGCVTFSKPNGTACGSNANNDCDKADTCNATGQCQTNLLSNGTVCTDDGNLCTDDFCRFGVCMHPNVSAGKACGSVATTDCDNADTCDAAGQCLVNLVPNGTACGNVSSTDCTKPDICQNGVCLVNDDPSGALCSSDGEDCTDDVCNGSGLCIHPTKPGCCDDECCNDDDCDDDNVCTTDRCRNARCEHTNNSNSCDDTLFCNGADTCSNGACAHRGNPCGADERCDEVDNACVVEDGESFSYTVATDPPSEPQVFRGFAPGEAAPILAPPAPEPGFVFDHWEGDVPPGHEFDDPLVIIMDSNKVFTAVFQALGCVDDAECDDGVFCDGRESCSENACVEGVEPCGEGASCNEETETCTARSEPAAPRMCGAGAIGLSLLGLIGLCFTCPRRG